MSSGHSPATRVGAIGVGFATSLLAHALTFGAVALVPALRTTATGVAVPIAVELELADSAPPVAAEPSLAGTTTHAAPRRIARQRAHGPAHLAGERAAVLPMAEPAAPARFALSAGVVASRAAEAPPAAPGPSTGSGAPIAEAQVDVPARLLTAPRIPYPPSARQAELEADVPLEIVVGEDGRVADARPLAHRGYGLDEAALAAIRTYRFSPALRAGHPVRVRMRWTVQFRLN